jgi:class 3 adenylate cyclase
MGFSQDIREEVKKIIRSRWSVREGKKIPDVEDLKLTNDAVTFEAVVLYADLADSTRLVTAYKPEFAAEVYKTYLISACRIIAKNSGEITAFDGDRVMAVFFEGAKNTNAAKTALNIAWATKMVNEELKGFYTSTEYTVKQAVGIDSGKLFVAKTGIRGANDLVWVGGAANYAAKLCALRDDTYTSWMTDNVFGLVLDEAKFSDGRPMWTQKYWSKYGRTVYGSSWWWEP